MTGNESKDCRGCRHANHNKLKLAVCHFDFVSDLHKMLAMYDEALLVSSPIATTHVTLVSSLTKQIPHTCW